MLLTRLSRSSDSNSGSEVSVPRSPKKKRKKVKKIRIKSPRPPVSLPVEGVEVWTPAMYQKWDRSGRPREKKRKHTRQDSDSDSKLKLKKPGFARSMSFDGKKTAGSKAVLDPETKLVPKLLLQRSQSSMGMGALESLGISHNYGPSSLGKPVSSLPKIPKLKKQENL
jgi:hypothetical protein